MILVTLFILWLVFWSFWSVLSSRLWDITFSDIFNRQSRDKKLWPIMKWILRGRSQCPNCHHTLHAIDLFPLISYASTGGKCRYCKKSISIIYPLREIGCGILFMVIGSLVMTQGFNTSVFAGNYYNLIYDNPTHLIFRLLTSRFLYLILIYDIQTMYLHEPLWIWATLTTIGLIFSSPHAVRYVAWMRSAIALWIFLALYCFARLYVRIRFKEDWEWFGSWDVRIAPLIGVQFWLWEYFTQASAIQNWLWFSRIDSSMHFIYYIIIASTLWILYAWIQKIIFPKKSVHSIPFLPWMIIALWIMMIWLYV